MVQNRRNFLKTFGAVGAVGLAGCGGDGDGDGGEGGTPTEGSTPTQGSGTTTSTPSGSSNLNFVISMKFMAQGGLFAQAKAGDWYTRDMPNVNVTIVDGQSSASEQTTRTINAMNADTSGVLLNPYDARASKQIVQGAKSMDIPVFNFDTATLSKDIEIGTLFGQYRGGKTAAERFKSEILPDLPENPNVLNAVFSFESTTSQQRLNGFTENVPDRVNFVDTIVSLGTPSDASKPILNAIRATDGGVDAIYSNNVGSGMGALVALKQLDSYYKKDHPDHVAAFGIDGGPELNQRIAAGYYNFAVDQPLHFYAPLSLELMFTHLGVDPPNSGTHPDTLPKPSDDKVTTDELMPKNKTVFGSQPWKNNFWTPADTTTYKADGTEWWPWVKARSAMITQDNAEAPYLYGNVLREFEN